MTLFQLGWSPNSKQSVCAVEHVSVQFLLSFHIHQNLMVTYVGLICHTPCTFTTGAHHNAALYCLLPNHANLTCVHAWHAQGGIIPPFFSAKEADREAKELQYTAQQAAAFGSMFTHHCFFLLLGCKRIHTRIYEFMCLDEAGL